MSIKVTNANQMLGVEGIGVICTLKGTKKNNHEYLSLLFQLQFLRAVFAQRTQYE